MENYTSDDYHSHGQNFCCDHQTHWHKIQKMENYASDDYQSHAQNSKLGNEALIKSINIPLAQNSKLDNNASME